MVSSFHWSARSVSGSRKIRNDDSFLIFSAGISGATELAPDAKSNLLHHDLIFGVSDGMGGGNAGHLASSMVLKTLSDTIPKTFQIAAQGLYPDYLELLQQNILDVHEGINAKAATDSHLNGMATTLTLAWFTPENLYIAHIGDTRLYRYRDGKTQQLTEDHSFCWKKLKRAEITEREYRCHPRRSILYEVIGGGHKKVTPSVAAIPYKSGDRFMLCSDGIIEGLWEKHIHSALAKNTDSTRVVADVLMSSAIDNDGSDDTTLIVIDVR